jgi:hypothetical protein
LQFHAATQCDLIHLNMSASYLLAGGGLIRLFSDTGVIAKGSPMLMALTISGQAYDVLPLCTSALEACWGFRRQHRPLATLALVA